MKEKKFSTYQIVFVAVMAAIVCVVTFFRFPFLGSKVHFANAMCLLSGMLFGPVLGGLAAGFGSMLYDALFGGYDLINCLITFVSKFLMAAICAWIAFGGKEDGKGKHARLVVGSVIGIASLIGFLPDTALCPRVSARRRRRHDGQQAPRVFNQRRLCHDRRAHSLRGNRPGAAPQGSSGKAPQIIEEKRQAARRKTLRAAFWMFRRRMLFPDRF